MITTILPAGLTDNSAEMYSENGVLKALTGGLAVRVIEHDNLKQPVYDHMVSRPDAHKRMIQWKGDNVDDQIDQYGQCLWGAFNSSPDLTADGVLSDPEFIQCSQKGMCKFEKDVCACFKLGDNKALSKAEERVLPHILWADRIIAEMLNVSPFTVTTQIKSIKNKLNVQTKAEVVDWAKDNGIVLCK